MLGHPTRDPHGAPIPTKDGRIDDTRYATLAELSPGETRRIAQVSDRDPAMLRYLAELGLYPETVVEVLERTPYGGSLRLLVGGATRDIGEELARQVFVSPLEGVE
jgi:DtxR family Mn-dependent transcriptional regulator